MNLEVFKRRCELPLASLLAMTSEQIAKPILKMRVEQQILDLQHLLGSVQESDLIPHAIFREPIACTDDAKRLFRYLHSHGLLFHPEDDPADCLAGKITEDEARELRHRMTEAWQQEWSEHDDPCGFCLTLSEN
jgi:hypothetical protein